MVHQQPPSPGPPRKFKFFSKTIAIVTVSLTAGLFYFFQYRPYAKRRYRAKLEEHAATYWAFEGNRALLESAKKKQQD